MCNFRVILLLSCCLLMTACSQQPVVSERFTAGFVNTILLFGLSKSSGGQVSNEEWESFVNQEITKRFPQGFTVVDAYGQWMDSDGKIHREPAKMLLVLYQDLPDIDQAVESLREDYKKRFQQESVIRFTTPANVSF